MEEKILNLIEKMYIEMQEMKENMATKQDIQRVEKNIVRLENKVENQEIRLQVLKSAK